jgi:hypothetical protein
VKIGLTGDVAVMEDIFNVDQPDTALFQRSCFELKQLAGAASIKPCGNIRKYTYGNVNDILPSHSSCSVLQIAKSIPSIASPIARELHLKDQRTT